MFFGWSFWSFYGTLLRFHIFCLVIFLSFGLSILRPSVFYSPYVCFLAKSKVGFEFLSCCFVTWFVMMIQEALLRICLGLVEILSLSYL